MICAFPNILFSGILQNYHHLPLRGQHRNYFEMKILKRTYFPVSPKLLKSNLGTYQLVLIIFEFGLGRESNFEFGY
jgi:hypothetical protein